MTLAQFQTLHDLIGASLSQNAEAANKCAQGLTPSLLWIGRYFDPSPDQVGKQILQGSYGAAVESVSLVAFGLIRPASLSLRAHYELSLQFLYYRHHPIEWHSVTTYRTQPLLPGVIRKYFLEHFSQYERRLTVLTKVKESSISDCYQVLSGIAHGTALNSISVASEPANLIEAQSVVLAAEEVFRSVGEALFDIHVALHDGNWMSLKQEDRAILERRFKDKNPRTELDL